MMLETFKNFSKVQARFLVAAVLTAGNEMAVDVSHVNFDIAAK